MRSALILLLALVVRWGPTTHASDDATAPPATAPPATAPPASAPPSAGGPDVKKPARGTPRVTPPTGGAAAVGAEDATDPASGDDDPGETDGPAGSPPPPITITTGAASGETSGPAADPLPQERVYIFVDRRTEAMGFVETEDDDVIVIRWKDEIQSFPKARVFRIVRLVEPLPGQRGLIVLRDGQRRRGTIIADDFETVILEIEGIRSIFPRSLVDHVELEPTFEQTLEALRKDLGPEDWGRRYQLARWLFDERRYGMAHDELKFILDRTEMAEAQRLMNFVKAQLLLDGGRRHDATLDQNDEDESGDGDGLVDQRDMLPDELLTDEDVNLIRIYEMNLRNPPRVAVEPDTIRTMIETYGASDLIPATSERRTALFRADPLDIVRLMFQLRARELYPEVQVLTEPEHLNLFRQRVHNAWLINNCATSRCHGGLDAGRFFLHNRNHRDPKVRYTNLMILDDLVVNDRPLIDYDEPMMSLIIQYGLPRTEARLPHPQVSGWRPAFTQANRRLLEDTVRWISDMYQPRPKYPIDYVPPDLSVPDAAPGGTDPSSPAQADR